LTALTTSSQTTNDRIAERMPTMQQDASPVEGSRHDSPSETPTPTRTGDNVAASDLTKSEVKTMYAVPTIFLGIVVVIALILVLVLFVFHH